MKENVFERRRVLVTGGLGFIGSNLARRLVERQADVTLIDSLIPGHGGNRFNIAGIEHRVRVDTCDLRDANSMRQHVQDKDYLFSLAGQSSHLDSMQEPLSDLEINCAAQLSVLEACRKCNPGIRIVFASTRQLYGRPDYLPVDEKHPVRPVDVNGIHAMASEAYHLLYHRVYGLWNCVLRLGNTVGPGMRVKDDRQSFLGIWIRLLLQGRALPVWGGEQLRDLAFVDDAVNAFILAASSESANGQIFNIGSDRAVSLRSLAEQLIAANGSGECQICEFPAARKQIDIGDYCTNFSKAASILGWQPTTPLPDALRRTLDYYRVNLQRYL